VVAFVVQVSPGDHADPHTPEDTVTTIPTPRTVTPLLLTGAAATVAASLATALVAAGGQALGVSTAVGGQEIPVPGFAVLTAFFSVVGLVLAVALQRFARRPRAAWVRTTLVLTALSFVPDLLADATVGTRLFLMLTHVVAAAIVIPAVARRLS
jgi:hypothetical protein